MVCSPVGLMSLMDRGFGPASLKYFLFFFFNRLGCSFYCEDHVHFHITTMLHDCWSLLASLGDQNLVSLPLKARAIASQF